MNSSTARNAEGNPEIFQMKGSPVHIRGGLTLKKLYIRQGLAKSLTLPCFKKPAHTWFLKIVSVQASVCLRVCVCACLPKRLLITSA